MQYQVLGDPHCPWAFNSANPENKAPVKPKTGWDNINFVQRRLRNAKRRAVYWSGNPSFNPHARAVDKHREHEFRYEMALNDVHSIGCILAKLEGRPEPQRRDYDPKREFGHKFVQMMGEIARKKV